MSKNTNIFQTIIDNKRENTKNIKQISWFSKTNNLIAEFPDEDNIPIYSSKLHDDKVVGYTNNNSIDVEGLKNIKFLDGSRAFTDEVIQKLVEDSRKKYYYNQATKNVNTTKDKEEVSTEELNKELEKEERLEKGLFNDYTDAEIYNLINRE